MSKNYKVIILYKYSTKKKNRILIIINIFLHLMEKIRNRNSVIPVYWTQVDFTVYSFKNKKFCFSWKVTILIYHPQKEKALLT